MMKICLPKKLKQIKIAFIFLLIITCLYFQMVEWVHCQMLYTISCIFHFLFCTLYLSISLYLDVKHVRCQKSRLVAFACNKILGCLRTFVPLLKSDAAMQVSELQQEKLKVQSIKSAYTTFLLILIHLPFLFSSLT